MSISTLKLNFLVLTMTDCGSIVEKKFLLESVFYESKSTTVGP